MARRYTLTEIEALGRSLREGCPREHQAWTQALEAVRRGDCWMARVQGVGSWDPPQRREMQELVATGQPEVIGQLLWLTAPGGRWTISASRAVARLGARHPDALHQELRREGLLEVPWGLELLYCAGDARAVPGLVALLQRGPGPVTQWALERLGQLRTPEGLQALVPWARSPAFLENVVALRALGKFRDPLAAQALWEAFEPRRAAFVTSLLGKCCRHTAPELVIEGLHHPELARRQLAVAALSRCEDPRIGGLLLSLQDPALAEDIRLALLPRVRWVSIRRFSLEIPRCDPLEVLLDRLAERSHTPLVLRPAPRHVLRTLARSGAPPALLALYGRLRGHVPGLLPAPWKLLPPALACFPIAHEWPFALARYTRRVRPSGSVPALWVDRQGRVWKKEPAREIVAEGLEALLAGQILA